MGAFVTDLDRTILRPGGRATEAARRALREVRAWGLPVLLVSGRPYEDLARLARPFGEWDGWVAEDGAVVEAPIGRPPRVRGLRTARAVRRRLAAHPSLQPELGRVVASVPRAQGRTLRRALAGLPVRIEANVDRLMVVPADLDKHAGIRTALGLLGDPRAGYAAIGDAENDIEMLRRAALSGAVANAIPTVRSVVGYVCRRPFDRGVLEFVTGPLRARVGPADA
ncbi:MAG: Cof-type HAD-IIB family hydrolase [Thermoplasmata archaeon]|nr:Cof-type HAD-IIB family hydrolase [Thermoplasmata archaeon]